MTYKNLPVYIDFETASLMTSGLISNYIPATTLTVSSKADSNARRLIGADIDNSDQFTHASALNTEISFNSLINTETSGALRVILDSTGNESCNIRFGGNIYSGCYLTSYDISVEPFKPVSLAANYIVNSAPKVNSESFYATKVIGSTNYLTYSEDLLGFVTKNEKPTGAVFLDPTGGMKAKSLNVLTGFYAFEYGYDLTQNDYTWTGISGSPSIQLTALQTNTDLSTGIAFTASKQFSMNGSGYSKVWISNNGIISFNVNDTGYSSPQTQEFPIADADRKFIAAYWMDLFASGGVIWYQQFADRFVIEYTAVTAIQSALPQTFQIHLIFATGKIEIKYNTVSPAGTFTPNPNVGIQWNPSSYINNGPALIDFNKNLLFTQNNISQDSSATLIHQNPVTPAELRTFSLYLKRNAGTGIVEYTLNSGLNWNSITPAVTSSWARYSFPATRSAQQPGIRVVPNSNLVSNGVQYYGAQLEPLAFATELIVTQGFPVTRATVVSGSLDNSQNLTTGFANKMINGHTCSISSTTGFISAIQSSIKYSVNCGRSPIYDIGSIDASNFILDSVEKQMDISSTELASFINFSGSNLAANLNLTLKDAQNIVGAVISMDSGSNIISQQSSIQEGDTLTTQVSIKQIIV